MSDLTNGIDSLVGGVADFLDPGDISGREATQIAGEIEVRLMEEALKLRQELFGELREDATPVRDARDQALDMISGLRTGEYSLPSNPALGFQQEESLRNLRNRAAAAGKFNSGGRLIAEQDTLANIASQDINQNINRLLNSAGFNTSNLNTNNALLQGAANGLAFNQFGVNNAQQNAAINNQNITNQLLNSAVGLGGYGYQNYLNNQQQQRNLINQDLNNTVFASSSGLF